MATVEGLQLRGSRYSLLVLIPKDLQALYAGKTRVVKALGTSDRAQAVLRGLQLKARWLEEFEAKRKAFRMGAGEPIQLGSPLPTPQPIEPSPVAFMDFQVASAASFAAPVFAPAPAVPQPAAPRTGKSLRDIHALWLKASPKSHETAQTSSKALSLAEECLGSPLLVHKITRAQGSAFKAWLQAPERGTSPKTAKDRLMYVNALLRFATQELEIISRNPWQGLSIEVPKKVTRVPWKNEELRTLFSQPLFQAHDFPPKGRAGGGAAAYWIPIIGLYTGARMGELVQLRVSDITEEEGIPVIRITDEDGKHLKTNASRRIVPLHPELIRLGLLDYAAELRRQAPDGSLWPQLLNLDPSNHMSEWFSRFRKSVGLTGRWLDFHSLRHTVRTKMARAQVPEKVMDAITGHETGGSTGRKVYTHLSTDDLLKAIQCLSYDSVNLPRSSDCNVLGSS